MSYIKITDEHLSDSRWLEAGPDAFALHIWALNYSNKMLLDGRIARAMAERVCLPIALDRVTDAIEALLGAGFWSTVGDKYLINDYESYALSADEIAKTRDRWKNDQRRRRKHGNGVHDECAPGRCNFLSHVDTHADSAAESRSESSTKTRPYETRPDQTFRSGSGMGSDGAAPADAEQRPALSVTPHRFVAPIDDPEHCGSCGMPREQHAPYEPAA